MTNLVWFRNNLRTIDNQSLLDANQGEKVIAVYFFDPRHYEKTDFGFRKTERFRAKFLIETVTELKKSLEQLNISLFVFQDRPENVIPKLVKQYGVRNIFLQKEWTRDENLVFDAVIANVPALVNFTESYDQFLFHPNDIPYSSFTEIPEIFTQFRKKCEKYCTVRPVVPPLKPMQKSNFIQESTKVPTLENLGFSDFETDYRTAFPFSGGELQGIKRIQEYFWETEKLAHYKKTRNGLVGKDYSSKLSPWLANGSLSARTIYFEIKHFEDRIIKNQDTYWLFFELIWRDYFKYISLKHGDKIFYQGGVRDRKYTWNRDVQAKERWISGNTEEPFVNANMKEISRTGWMSNRGRQNVASFWAKELQQDWRIGAAYFESMLIDYDVHSNWCNWMYSSGIGNDPRDRKFNIKKQAQMYDPKGTFQNLWLQDTLF